MRCPVFVVSVLGLFAVLLATLAQAGPVPPPPPLDARSYVLMDADTGRVLAASHPDLRTEPASLTKLMTAYAVFHALKAGSLHLGDMATISEKAWHMGGSRSFLKLGSRVSIDDLLQGLLVQSGNDAAVALAERVAGTEAAFVELMNHYARALGMTNTHYVNASGLTNDPDHYVSALDMAHLARAIIDQFPQYYHYFSEKQFTWNNITQRNRVSLLFTDPSVDGLKTGFTDKAGYCMVASARRQGMRLIAVAMGAHSPRGRARDDQALLDYGFGFYDTRKLYAAGTVLARLRAWKGSGGEAPVGVIHNVYVTIPRSAGAVLSTSLQTPSSLMAPVAKGTPAGALAVSMDGKMLTRIPLYTLRAVPEGNIVRRLADSLRWWF